MIIFTEKINMENKELYLILLANPENATETMGFGSLEGFVICGNYIEACQKANELTNGEEVEFYAEDPKCFLGTTSVIKLNFNPEIEEGPIEGFDLYELIEIGSEDPRDAISSILNTIG
jgi:hypothetical protein